MDDDYAEYRCSACKKAIKNQVVTCKSCSKLFYHPSCVSKHKIYDKNRELVTCPGPLDKFIIEGVKEANMKKTSTPASGSRERLGSTGSIGSGAPNLDTKIDWIIRSIREIKEETACKKEIKMMIKEIIQEEIDIIRKGMDELRRMIKEGTGVGDQRSYSEVAKEKKKESVIIIKPKIQQESEATKKNIKEKVDIKNLAMGVTKFKKGSNGTVIMGCEAGEEMEKLKTEVQARLGENFMVTESLQVKPKIKIVNIDEDEIKLDDNDLIDVIKRQNKIPVNKEFQMRIVKKIIKEKRNYRNQSGRRGREEGVVIMETDEKTHELILNKRKINVGWKKCSVFNHINIKRCFKCWGYYHIAKNCTREETCHKCAGKHKADECKVSKKRCVNCMFKNQTYNLKINDEHDALDPECPTYKRAIQEEKKRAGWKDNK